MVGESLLQLFKESSVIYAPQKLSLEYPIGPPSETHSLRRFDAISDLEDDIQIIILDLPGHGTVALSLNCRKFCDS